MIIGRLIPAGTGFNAYNHNINNYSLNHQNISHADFNQMLNQGTENYFEDIILDDRGARNITNLEHDMKDLQPNTDII